jgi:hypothetical protein
MLSRLLSHLKRWSLPKLSVDRIHLLKRMTEELRPIHVLAGCQRWHGAMDACVYSRDIECRVQRSLGRLRLLDFWIDRWQDGTAALAGGVARGSCLVFGAHCVSGRWC